MREGCDHLGRVQCRLRRCVTACSDGRVSHTQCILSTRLWSFGGSEVGSTLFDVFAGSSTRWLRTVGLGARKLTNVLGSAGRRPPSFPRVGANTDDLMVTVTSTRASVIGDRRPPRPVKVKGPAPGLNAKHTTLSRNLITRLERFTDVVAYRYGQSSVDMKVDGVSELVYLRIEYMRKGRAKQVEHPTLLGVWTDRSQRSDGG